MIFIMTIWTIDVMMVRRFFVFLCLCVAYDFLRIVVYGFLVNSHRNLPFADWKSHFQPYAKINLIFTET